MLAHLSVLLNVVSGFLGVLVPLGIYLIHKDRSRYVAYQSLQSFIFQIVCWIGGWALVVLLGILSAIPLIGIVFWPLACLAVFIPIVPLVYGIVAAIKSNNGEDFKYPLVGNWVRGTYTGQPRSTL